MDDLIKVLAVLFFLLINALVMMAQRSRQKADQKNEANPPAPPARGVEPARRESMPRSTSTPSTQSVWEKSATTRRTQPESPQPTLQPPATPIPPVAQPENPWGNWMEELFGMENPVLEIPQPKPRPKPRREPQPEISSARIPPAKIHQEKPSTAPPVEKKSLKSPISKAITRPQPIGLTHLLQRAEKNPLRAAVILSEILRPPLALRPRGMRPSR